MIRKLVKNSQFGEKKLSKVRTFFRVLTSKMPGASARRFLLRRGGVKVGANALVERGASIGKDVHIGDNAMVFRGAVVKGGCKLSEGVSISPYAVIQHCLIGRDSWIERGVLMNGTEEHLIELGENSTVGKYCTLDGSGGLHIGSSVQITAGTAIWSHSSIRQAIRGDALADKTHVVRAPVSIEDNIWIGGNCTIYPGVTIGHHSVVLPGSVVTKDVASYTMVGGAPATLKRKISIVDDEVHFAKE